MTHGTLTGYSYHGCRCDLCKQAAHAYYRDRTLNRGPRLTDATGTRRRIQALMWVGWTREDMAGRLGVTKGGLSRMLSGTSPKVNTKSARKVADLFDELCMTQGPSRLTAGHARARGYAPPLAWDDIDDPAEEPNVGEEGGLGSGRRKLHIEDVEFLLARDAYTREGLATRLGVTRSALEQRLYRAGRRDLTDQLTTNTHGYRKATA